VRRLVGGTLIASLPERPMAGPTTVDRVRVGVLGDLEVIVDGEAVEIAAPKQRAVLTVLALQPGRLVRLSELIDGVWGDEPPPTATKSLQSHVSRLRALVGRDVVRGSGGGYLLDIRSADVDASQFESAVEQGRHLLASGRFAEADDTLTGALDLWRGEALTDLGDGTFAAGASTRLHELKLGAEEDRSAARSRAGRAEAAVVELEALVESEPLRERRWELLIEALYRAGRQADALRAFQRARARLADELGIEPGPALREMESRVLAQDPTLLAASSTVPEPELPTGVVTLLLTDIEGSTLLWDEEPEAMAPAVERHTELIRSVVAEHGGRFLKEKGEGDSTFSVFADADAAVAAALAVRTALTTEPWPTSTALVARIAAATGNCELRDGDYFGPHVNRAARIRSEASGGEVLLSSITYQLTADSTLRDHHVTDLASHDLRGLRRPEQIWRVEPDTGADAGAHRSLDPAAASNLDWVPTSIGGFSGRDIEWARLQQAWDATVAGTRRFVLVSGEPGIGKTHLAGHLATLVGTTGGLVLFGRCPPDGTSDPAMADALSHYLGATPLDVLAHQIGSIGSIAGELTRIAPDLADRIGGLQPLAVADPDEARLRLARAVAALLAAIATEAPILLVIDDLHWAGTGTLAIVRHLVEALPDDTPVLVVGTYRDTDLDRTHPLSALRADLRRRGGAERLDLTGLDADGIRTFMAAAAGHPLEPEIEPLAEVLLRETGGNPLFVGEVLAHLAESGSIVRRQGRWVAAEPIDTLPIPEGLAEVIGRRLDALSVEANEVLRAAAVVGAQFDLATVEAVAHIDSPVLDVLDDAAAAGIVREASSFGAYEFSHAVVRSTLLDELSVTRRVSLHWAIGLACEARGSGEAAAHHLLEGRLAGDPFRAARAALDAGRLAVAQGDLHRGRTWAERGLDAIDNDDQRELAADLHMVLADSWRVVLGSEVGQTYRARAIAAAVHAGDTARIAKACSFWGIMTMGSDPAGLIPALSAALRALPDHERGARSIVNASLAGALAFMTGDRTRCLDSLASALELFEPHEAEAARHVWVCVAALVGGHLGAAKLGREVAEGFEFDPILADDYIGRSTLVDNGTALLSAYGRLDDADLLYRRTVDGAPDRALFEAQHGLTRLAVVLMRGDLGRVLDEFDEVLATYAALGVGRSYLDAAVPYMHGIIARHQGTAAELAPLLDQVSIEYPENIAWHGAHAVALAAAGRIEEAIDKVDQTMADDIAAIGASSYSHALVVLTEASVACGHLDALPTLRRHMEVWPPFLATQAWGCWGGGWQALGWISAALGETERAREEYTNAVEQFGTAGMRAYHAWSLQDLAELEAGEGHLEPARRLAQDAKTEAADCQAHAITARAERLLSG
jgi:DNA-binding SARP family transcriptional activator